MLKGDAGGTYSQIATAIARAARSQDGVPSVTANSLMRSSTLTVGASAFPFVLFTLRAFGIGAKPCTFALAALVPAAAADEGPPLGQVEVVQAKIEADREARWSAARPTRS